MVTPNKPGKINECHQCGAVAETEARVGGNMVWEGKQAPYIEVKSMKDAKKFASKTRRLGAGVTASLVQNKNVAERSLFRNGTWMSDDSLEGD